jgi:hypothetical protein
VGQLFIIQINTNLYFTSIIPWEVGPATCGDLGRTQLVSFFIWIEIEPCFLWTRSTFYLYHLHFYFILLYPLKFGLPFDRSWAEHIKASFFCLDMGWASSFADLLFSLIFTTSSLFLRQRYSIFLW